jgi:hypothetical protein
MDEFMERPHRQSNKEGRGLEYGAILDSQNELNFASRFRPSRDISAAPTDPAGMRTRGGTSGNPMTAQSSEGLWIWPLPIASALELIVRWPAMGVNESRTPLTLGDLAEASTRAQPLWSLTGERSPAG